MNYRLNRFSKMVQKIVAEVLVQEMGADIPEITEVKISPDLRHATVMVHPQENKDVVEQLNNYKPAIQSELGAKLESKFTPRVSFRIDETAQHVRRIDDLLDSIK
ncbi:MAG: ribosome-binding factor A [Candidatus Saccharimonadales bacterium]